MVVPDIWGKGSIFAFSGIDGKNTYTGSLAGTLCADKLGIIFHTDKRRELSFIIKNVKDIKYDIVASDIIKLQLVSKYFIHEEQESQEEQESLLPLILVFYSQDTIVGISGKYARPVVYCENVKEEELEDGIIIHSTPPEYTVLITEEKGKDIRFSFSYSNISKADAIEKAKEGLYQDINELVHRKMDFFKNLPKLEGVDKRLEKTFYKCFSVMKTQVYTPEGMFKSRWTTPDRLPHKKLWLWDSVFHSFGNRYICTELAYETIKAVFDTQREDGFIPHMASPFERSDITQPPVLAWGLFKLYEATGRIDILYEHYSKLKAYLFWNINNRDSNRNFLFEWKINKHSVENRCDESGMDNSVRFDNVEEMDCIDFSCFMANEAKCMSRIADALEMNGEKELWDDIYAKIKKAVNENLWDEEDKFYYDRKIKDGNFKKVKAVSGFLPLFVGICEKRHSEHLIRHLTDKKLFSTEFPIPSIAFNDKSFEMDMWRGCVWINYNYMIVAGLREYGYDNLADSLIRETIEKIAFWYEHDGNIYEFYDCTNRFSPSRLNRKGKYIEPYDFRINYQSLRDYGWTCTLFVAMLMENIYLFKHTN